MEQMEVTKAPRRRLKRRLLRTRSGLRRDHHWRLKLLSYQEERSMCERCEFLYFTPRNNMKRKLLRTAKASVC